MPSNSLKDTWGPSMEMSAAKVGQFCCAEFAKKPGAWQVKNNRVKQLDTKEWAAWMMEADPGQGAESTMTVILLGVGREEREVLF